MYEDSIRAGFFEGSKRARAAEFNTDKPVIPKS